MTSPVAVLAELVEWVIETKFEEEGANRGVDDEGWCALVVREEEEEKRPERVRDIPESICYLTSIRRLREEVANNKHHRK